jgi:hypothetical protein
MPKNILEPPGGILSTKAPAVVLDEPAARASVHRIGLVLVGFEKKLSPPLQYLLLQLNRLQRTYECEFLPDGDEFFASSLAPQTIVDRTQLKVELPDLIAPYEKHVDRLRLDFKIQEEPPKYFVIISRAKFSDDYYTTRRGNVSVIALGNWKRKLAPPTEVEFLLTLAVREAVAALSPALRSSVHLGTKGCICDFTYEQSDARFKVLSAFVCAYCRSAMKRDNLISLADEVEEVLAKKWLGRSTDFTSPANITSKLGHRLFTTKALTPTWWERLLANVQEEGMKQVAKAIGYLVPLLLALLVGLVGGSDRYTNTRRNQDRCRTEGWVGQQPEDVNWRAG